MLTIGIEEASLHRSVASELAQGRRADSRSFDECRAITATQTPGAATSPSGAGGQVLRTVTCTSGPTIICCGVTATLGPTDPERPSEGRCEVVVSTPFALRKPSAASDADDARQILALFLQECADAMIDATQLCVIAGEACWALRVDVVVTSSAGPVHDVALAAVRECLRGATIAVAVLPDGTPTAPVMLELRCHPIGATMVLVLGTELVSDPTAAEAAVADAELIVVIDAATSAVLRVVHCGGYPVHSGILQEAVRRAQAAAAPAAEALRLESTVTVA